MPRKEACVCNDVDSYSSDEPDYGSDDDQGSDDGQVDVDAFLTGGENP